MKRKGLKIFLSTAMCIFNLFTCFAGVYAWFTASQHNDVSGPAVQMYTHELDMSYRVFKYSDDEKAGVEVTGQQDALTLQRYDSVIKSRNVNTPIILEFLLSGVALGDNIPIDITSYCTDATLTNKVISNIVKLQFAPINIDSDDADEIYTTAVNYFKTESIPEIQFKNGSNKDLEVTYTLTNYSSYLNASGLNLFIMLDYSETLVDTFTFDIQDVQTTNFTNDLTSINCIANEN